MPTDSSWSQFLKSKHALFLTAMLTAQGLGLLAISRQERVPLVRPLEEFPTQLGRWQMLEQGVIEKDVRDVLKADDLLTRTYGDPVRRQAANLFIAYFKSQRTGQAPHSPKNCLPGSGWVPSNSGVMSIPVPGAAEPIEVNRYVVSKGEERSLVLYWYQTHNRVIANEYRAKIFLVADAIRYNRTDTALVRVVVRIVDNGEEAATNAATDFVKSFFDQLHRYLPN